MKHLSVIAVLIFAACASTNVGGDAETSIARHNREFVQAARAGNAAGLAAVYADDAILMAPNAPSIRGRSAIQQFWTGFLGLGQVDLNLNTQKVMSSCDLATEVGTYTSSITPQGGATMKDSGKYAVTWRNIGGDWKIVADIFNSDLPATAPPR